MDFKSISEVLNFAMSKEKASEQFYLDLAEQMDDHMTQAVFRTIAAQEKNHVAALEVGETPLEGVLREVLEETGIPCRPAGFVGVFDSRRCGLASRHHIYLFTFLLTPKEGERRAVSHANEVLDVHWYPEDALPADIHPGSLSRIALAYRLWRGDAVTYYDS